VRTSFFRFEVRTSFFRFEVRTSFSYFFQLMPDCPAINDVSSTNSR